MSEQPAAPECDCQLCPRLVEFREANRHAFPDWHNAPVESFGPPDAELLIIGLAPGLRGANRTSRPFTGDAAGVLLYRTLGRYSFASGSYDERVNDGLTLQNCRVTNAVLLCFNSLGKIKCVRAPISLVRSARAKPMFDGGLQLIEIEMLLLQFRR